MCPRGEIGRHKGLKKPRVEIFYSLIQSQTVLNPIKSYILKKPLIIFIGKYE